MAQREGKQYYGYGSYPANSASQTSNANSGAGGTAISCGTRIANWKRSVNQGNLNLGQFM